MLAEVGFVTCLGFVLCLSGFYSVIISEQGLLTLGLF